MRLVAEGDSPAVVVHNDINGTAISPYFKGNFNGRRAAMLQGVIHQMVKRLFYSKSVGLDPWQMLRRVDCNRCTDLADTRIQPFEDSVHTFEKIDQLEVEADLPGFQLRNCQEIFDQEIQALCMFVHRLQETEIGLRISSSLDERFEITSNDRQVGSQLMGNIRHKLFPHS